MDKENKSDNSEFQPPSLTSPEKPEQVNSAPAVAATAKQLAQVEEQMSAFEKSTLRWAKTAVFLSALAAIFVCLQWWEMHTGSTDTHNLAIAANNQATWTQRLAGSAGIQADRTKDLADRMKEQADRTKDLADQAKVQATEAIVAANAAKSAAETADKALHISERAYLTMGSPIDDFPNKLLNVPIFNAGHVPSGPVEVVVHEITVKLDPSDKALLLANIVERHWQVINFESIPVVPTGSLFLVEVHLPSVVQDDLNAHRQGIVIAATLTYNDGFPNTPKQSWLFCDLATWESGNARFAMRPCSDPLDTLKILTKADEYPSTKYQDPN